MTRDMGRIRAARAALLTLAAWLFGWTALLLIVGITATRADEYCFESDAANIADRNQWTHHSVVLWSSRPRVSANGTAQLGLSGYGYDDAPKPGGGTDLVPLVGAAVKDVDGTWLISLTGTLLQYSTVGMFEGTTYPAYYLISLWWQVGTDLVGHGHVGNVTAGFSPHIPGATDDSYATGVWPVDCASLR